MSIITVNKSNFEAEVLKSDKPVLVDFFADWCGPCKSLAPILEEIATERADDIKIVKIDVDQDPELAAQYGVRSMPTLAVFKEGVAVSGITGARPKSDLNAFIDDAIQKDPAVVAQQMQEQQDRVINAIFDKALELKLVNEDNADNKAEAIDTVFKNALEGGIVDQQEAMEIANPLQILEVIAERTHGTQPTNEEQKKMEKPNKLKNLVNDVTKTFNETKEQLKKPEVQDKLKKDAQEALETGKAAGKAATNAAKQKLKKFLGK